MHCTLRKLGYLSEFQVLSITDHLQLSREQVRQVLKDVGGDSGQPDARHVSGEPRQDTVFHDQEQGTHTVLQV